VQTERVTQVDRGSAQGVGLDRGQSKGVGFTTAGLRGRLLGVPLGVLADMLALVVPDGQRAGCPVADLPVGLAVVLVGVLLDEIHTVDVGVPVAGSEHPGEFGADLELWHVGLASDDFDPVGTDRGQ
jgi:hypothetical protein